MGKWKKHLVDYWDDQLIHLLRYGFPLDFNRDCHLKTDKQNHASAIKYPGYIKAYLQEEIAHGAILGPFTDSPIVETHHSPFMSRDKPGSKNHRVIIDLSWPKGNLVNDSIHKDSYLGTDFCLSFPTVVDITSELNDQGRGCHLYKIDTSRAFCHIKVDLADYDLLGLHWGSDFIDMYVPFGSKRGFEIINYVDDFIGVGLPSVAEQFYNCLYGLLTELGFAISAKKLVKLSTKAVCLRVLIDSAAGTIAVPEEKLVQIRTMVSEWSGRAKCTRKQLQSLLGHLIYIHKCVKPSRIFVNRMLDLLRSHYDDSSILLSPDFHRDLKWFSKFLEKYNLVSFYDNRSVNVTLELDACLTGLGARFDNFVYHLPIPLGYNNLGIVHHEMVNILLAVRVFQDMWPGKHLLVKCDNQAVVQVLTSGKTHDPYLAACSRNIWQVTASKDIDITYVHVLGKNNIVADLL